MNPSKNLEWHELHTTNSHTRATQIIASGVSPSIEGKGGVTPLHIHSDPQVLRLLLEKGADPNCLAFGNESPLHLASSLECIMVLLEFGADPTYINNDGELPEECYGDNEMERAES